MTNYDNKFKGDNIFYNLLVITIDRFNTVKYE